MSTYTEDDLERAAALRYSVIPAEFDELDDAARDRVRNATRRILDAVAPAIAARALREFATDRVIHQTPARLIEDLFARADEIEADR